MPACSAMNSLPRWLTSITETPLPFQSSISLAAWRRTGSGRAAGPGLKLKGRGMTPIIEPPPRGPPGAASAEGPPRPLSGRCGRRLGRLGGFDLLALLRADAVVDDPVCGHG